ncbi:MAG: hypothetical protein KJZ87_03730 [Thermoguttaceae bacterium]|nr:hypothetical protein [Thermoguttaceae bacterium]
MIDRDKMGVLRVLGDAELAAAIFVSNLGPLRSNENHRSTPCQDIRRADTGSR